MEPTIYKPSIYKGAGIYKIGAEGGGGGGGNTIKIGTHDYKWVLMPDGKKWLAQNLELIFPTLVIGETSSTSSYPQAHYYDNNQTTYSVFGGSRPCGLLYNQKAVDYLVNHNNLIAGCHVPTTTEWNDLFSSIGSDSDAAKKIKCENGAFKGWPSGWGGLDDPYEFCCVPGGRYDGSFGLMNECFYRTVSGTYIEIRNDNYIYRYGSNSNYGYSVRLIVD
jgi:uncharacterized protein (TIGR02145 family)